ncbi:hypothetical protein, partial [Gracilimonas mengyeensis]|uniref:hypothetical protein n=1 Tax=Gracilimonas mengyeensis TaxID=1302730 RepID=UPI001C8F40E0
MDSKYANKSVNIANTKFTSSCNLNVKVHRKEDFIIVKKKAPDVDPGLVGYKKEGGDDLLYRVSSTIGA